jgi:type II secretory ATPase GspE/PulE/Tfp pilus assembly ATPase PilB-like protein
LTKQKTSNKLFGEIAIESGLISEEDTYSALGKQFNLNFLDNITSKNRIDWNLIKDKKIWSIINDSEEEFITFAIKNNFYPAFYEKDKNDNNHLIIAITKKLTFATQATINDLEEGLNCKVTPVLITPSIASLFKLKYKGILIDELISFSKEITQEEEEKEGITVELFLKMLLTFSIINDVSDIHIEPSLDGEYRISVRESSFRYTICFIDQVLGEMIIAVIKNNSKMDSQIKQVPQDGMLAGSVFLNKFILPINRFGKKTTEFNFENNTFRVSSYPLSKSIGDSISENESLVIRVLSTGGGGVSLSSLGISESTLTELDFASTRNQGIIIIVGPTGSGKSTTLYSALSKIDPVKKKIITFEDPVEIRNMYWAQGERKPNDTNKKLNFDFKEAKKSILRQDPDVILMGETRDEESAKFSLEAANTGHLVLTTLHANSAAGAFERLMKLGINNLELSSSVLCILSQRLVRKVCPHCLIEEDSNKEIESFFKRIEIDKVPEKVIRHNKNGCIYCNHKGFIGRMVLDEVIPITSKIKIVISENAPEYKIREEANKLGYKTMLENGLDKMSDKLTTIDEIIRVI